MILFLKPLFKERIWGGTRLKTLFNYDLPSDTIGECWGICAHPNGESIIINSPFQGESLKTLWDEHRHLFGDKEGDSFPLLVKLIDASDDLSIQVHPNDTQAIKHHSLGKSECWYILKTEPNTKMIIGHHARTKQAFIEYLDQNKILDIVNIIDIKEKDYFYIEAGTLHAICKGTLLLEVQQSSDITYRIYDYNRLENNQPRTLHLEEALEVIKIPNQEILKTHKDTYFSFEVITASSLNKKAHLHGDFLVVLEGEGFLNNLPIKKGDFIFISSLFTYTIKGELTLAKIHIS